MRKFTTLIGEEIVCLLANTREIAVQSIVDVKKPNNNPVVLESIPLSEEDQKYAEEYKDKPGVFLHSRKKSW